MQAEAFGNVLQVRQELCPWRKRLTPLPLLLQRWQSLVLLRGLVAGLLGLAGLLTVGRRSLGSTTNLVVQRMDTLQASKPCMTFTVTRTGDVQFSTSEPSSTSGFSSPPETYRRDPHDYAKLRL